MRFDVPLQAHIAKHALVSAVLCAATLLAAPFAHADAQQDVAKLINSGKLQEALQRADAYLATKPKDAQMRFLKAVVLSDQGKNNDAIEVFTRLTQDYPELPEPYNNLAVLYAAAGQYDKARAALETAIRTDPKYATAYENLGDVYAKLAAQSYEKTHQLDAGKGAAETKLRLIRELLASVDKKRATDTTSRATTIAPQASPTRPQANVGLPTPAAGPASAAGVGATRPEVSAPPTQAPSDR